MNKLESKYIRGEIHYYSSRMSKALLDENLIPHTEFFKCEKYKDCRTFQDLIRVEFKICLAKCEYHHVKCDMLTEFWYNGNPVTDYMVGYHKVYFFTRDIFLKLIS